MRGTNYTTTSFHSKTTVNYYLTPEKNRNLPVRCSVPKAIPVRRQNPSCTGNQESNALHDTHNQQYIQLVRKVHEAGSRYHFRKPRASL